MRCKIDDCKHCVWDSADDMYVCTKGVFQIVKGTCPYRECAVCGNMMSEGYVVDDTEYYCSADCLYTNYTAEEYEKLYDRGVAYWTVFDE